MPTNDTLLAPVAFAYEGKVVETGKRKPGVRLFRDVTSARIRRIGPSDLVPAAVLHDACITPMHVVMGEQRLYGFEGALWSEAPFVPEDLRGHGRLDAARTVTPEEFLAAAAQGLEPGPFGAGLDQPFGVDRMEAYGVRRPQWINVPDAAYAPVRANRQQVAVAGLPTLDDAAVRKVESLDRDRAAADVQRVADAVVFAGDRVLFRRFDPSWWLRPNDLMLLFGQGRGDHASTFRADRLDEALRWFGRQAELLYDPKGREEPKGPPGIIGRAEILDGSLFTADDLRGYTEGVCWAVEHSLPLLSSAPAEKLAEWARMRDLAVEVEKNWTRSGAEEVVRAYHGMRQTLTEIRGENAGRDRREQFGHVDRSFAFVTERAFGYDAVPLPEDAKADIGAIRALAS